MADGGGLRATLEDGLAALGVGADPEQLAALLTHLGEIERFNPRLGLVEAEGAELVERHLLDCIAGVSSIQALLPSDLQPGGWALADLGSGAGLPGVAIAILEPRLVVTLVERSGRRAGFLRNLKAVLRRPDIQVREHPFERCGEPFDIVTFRALTELTPKSARDLAQLVKPGGRLVAYKGRHERARAEAEAARAEFETVEVLPLEVPFLDEERCLVIGRKGV